MASVSSYHMRGISLAATALTLMLLALCARPSSALPWAGPHDPSLLATGLHPPGAADADDREQPLARLLIMVAVGAATQKASQLLSSSEVAWLAV
mmetsp:Transcript_95726/g.249377  ORF Transcript_95726/g.249377 Transcript_95726/m.249377 type:complete len:95 (-) Transcript_95726:211-495(-)